MSVSCMDMFCFTADDIFFTYLFTTLYCVVNIGSVHLELSSNVIHGSHPVCNFVPSMPPAVNHLQQ